MTDVRERAVTLLTPGKSPEGGGESGLPTRPGRGGMEWATIVGGALVSLGGLAVIVAWHLDAISLLRPNARATPIVYNTGVAFLITGVALMGAVAGWSRIVLAAAGIDIALAAVTLLQAVLDRSLGIDGLLFDTTVGRPVRYARKDGAQHGSLLPCRRHRAGGPSARAGAAASHGDRCRGQVSSWPSPASPAPAMRPATAPATSGKRHCERGVILSRCAGPWQARPVCWSTTVPPDASSWDTPGRRPWLDRDRQGPGV